MGLLSRSSGPPWPTNKAPAAALPGCRGGNRLSGSGLLRPFQTDTRSCGAFLPVSGNPSILENDGSSTHVQVGVIENGEELRILHMIPAKPEIRVAIPTDKPKPLKAFIVIDSSFKPDLLPIRVYAERLHSSEIFLEIKHLKGKVAINAHTDHASVPIGAVKDTSAQGDKHRKLAASFDIQLAVEGQVDALLYRAKPSLHFEKLALLLQILGIGGDLYPYRNRQRFLKASESIHHEV